MDGVATVTVLMTDLVGSTALSMAIGPEPAERLRREHFAVLRGPLDDHGGTEVKNLGDGLMVVFDTPSSAAACAVAMQQALEQRNRRADQQLSVRMGLSVGETDIHDGDYFGRPVIEASRLCAAAEGGQILATAVLGALAGSRHQLRFAPVGELELKGIPEPVAAAEVTWEPAGEGGAGFVPLPPPLRGVPPLAYVGRERERETLARMWAGAAEGRRGVALLSGEPGIGKSRLASYTALAAHADGAAVLLGRCSEDVGAAFKPWAEALDHLVEHVDDAILREHAERHGGELARLAPSLHRRLPDVPAPRESDRDTERYLLFQAVVDLIERAAASRPVLLLLDDAHWADAPSLALVRHVAEATPATPLVLLLTYRDSDLSPGHPLSDVLASLHRQDGTERLPLTGLPEPDVVAIMSAAAAHELAEDGRRLATALWRETDGNPFFLGEMLRHLRESEAIVQQEDGRWALAADLDELPLPQSVRDVVSQRVARLGDDVQRMLTVAAVIGRDFELDLLARVLQRDEDELLDGLEEAMSASVVFESAERAGAFIFAHALINHTLYDELGRTRRARWHRAVAEALEALYGDDPGERLGDLAHHWASATAPTDITRAVGYACRAGNRALEGLAPDDALRWFGQAGEMLASQSSPEWETRCDVLVGRGEAERRTAQGDFRSTLVEASRLALEHGDDDRLAAAVLANSRGRPSAYGLVDEERVELIEAALERTPAARAAQRARLLSLLALELSYEAGGYDRRRALSDESVALARAADDDRALGQVLRDRAFVLASPDQPPARREAVEELAAVAERVRDPALTFWAAISDVDVSMTEAELTRAERAIEHAAALAAELAQPSLLWTVAWAKAGLALSRDVAAAPGLVQAALDAGNAAHEPDAIMIYAAQTSQQWWLQGELDRELEQLAFGTKQFPGLPGFEAAYAYVLAQLGRTDEAAAVVREAAADDFRTAYWDTGACIMLQFWADAVLLTGDRDAAAALEPYLARTTQRLGSISLLIYHPTEIGRAFVAAALGRHDEAHARWRDGWAQLRALDLPLSEPRPLLTWGMWLAGHDEDAARAALGEARDVARRHGAVGPLEIAERALARLGAPAL